MCKSINVEQKTFPLVNKKPGHIVMSQISTFEYKGRVMRVQTIIHCYADKLIAKKSIGLFSIIGVKTKAAIEKEKRIRKARKKARLDSLIGGVE